MPSSSSKNERNWLMIVAIAGASTAQAALRLSGQPPESSAQTAADRIRVLVESDDGFKIAEADYSERGGGDFFGMRQSGKIATDLGALRYTAASVFLAKKIADEMSDANKISPELRRIAMLKYDKLKNVALN